MSLRGAAVVLSVAVTALFAACSRGGGLVDPNRLGDPDTTGTEYPPSPLTPEPDVPPLVVVDGAIAVVRSDNAVDTVHADPLLDARKAFWSPDGSLIAFEGTLDDPGTPGQPFVQLFVIDSTGAGRTPLFDGPSSAPSWAPDGSRLVFHTPDAELWVVAADGTGLRRLASADPMGRYPAWSPDGPWIAYLGEDDAGVEGLYRVAEDDSARDRIAEGAITVASRAPRYSPTGDRLLWEVSDDVVVMNADGGGLRPLTSSADAERGSRWSPDGSMIAYMIPGTVEVIDARSGALLDRFTGVGFPLDPAVSWNPDGVGIAFASGGSIGIGRLGRATQWSVVTRGSWVGWFPGG